MTCAHWSIDLYAVCYMLYAISISFWECAPSQFVHLFTTDLDKYRSKTNEHYCYSVYLSHNNNKLLVFTFTFHLRLYNTNKLFIQIDLSTFQSNRPKTIMTDVFKYEDETLQRTR